MKHPLSQGSRIGNMVTIQTRRYHVSFVSIHHPSIWDVSVGGDGWLAVSYERVHLSEMHLSPYDDLEKRRSQFQHDDHFK